MHLTFARRAYELADWYRQCGSLVVLGGLHVLSCPDEAAEHADAIAVGEGVQLWPEILGDIERGRLRRRYEGSYRHPLKSYRDEPAPRRGILPRESFLTNDQHHRDSRVPQPLRILLSLDGGPGHALSGP